MDDIDLHLFGGCCLEAQRCDVVARRLPPFQHSISDPSRAELAAVVEEIRLASRLLRELADLSQVDRERADLILNHLNILLPCLSRSLRDIQDYCEGAGSRQDRWIFMSRCMMDETGISMSLGNRFVVYNDFLTPLRDLLMRSPNIDFHKLEAARIRVMLLRESRGIPDPPALVVSPMCISDVFLESNTNPHWARDIFSQPPPSRTALENQHRSVVATRSLELWGHLPIAEQSRILFRRPFNNDSMSVTAYESGLDGCSHLLVRVTNPKTHPGAPLFSQHGCHELCIRRDGSLLTFKRWSKSSHCSKIWISLNFLTWEELILMYCTFVVLKARSDRTIKMGPDDLVPAGENKLFQAIISDDGFWHDLVVYQDKATGGIRLLAAVCDGQLRHCPVWTAFVTHQAVSPSWVKRVSRRKVHIRDVQLYVFCSDYNQNRQRRGNAGVFEVKFHGEEACHRFTNLFPIASRRPGTPRPISVDR